MNGWGFHTLTQVCFGNFNLPSKHSRHLLGTITGSLAPVCSDTWEEEESIECSNCLVGWFKCSIESLKQKSIHSGQQSNLNPASHTIRAWSERGSLSICPRNTAPKEPALNTHYGKESKGFSPNYMAWANSRFQNNRVNSDVYGLTVFPSPDSSLPSAAGLKTVYMFALLPVISKRYGTGRGSESNCVSAASSASVLLIHFSFSASNPLG